MVLSNISNRKCQQGFTLVIVAVVLLGCGKSGENETARVHGIVTLNGKPYTQGGSVLFQPKVSGRMATGKIQDDGSYDLTTYSPGDGAIVGKHQVMVIYSPPEIDEELAELRHQKPVASPIPARYGEASKSDLAYDVQSGEVNEFSIELKSK